MKCNKIRYSILKKINVYIAQRNVKSKKTPGPEHSGNLEHLEKNKSKNNSREKRRNPEQRPRKYFRQTIEESFPNLKWR